MLVGVLEMRKTLTKRSKQEQFVAHSIAALRVHACVAARHPKYNQTTQLSITGATRNFDDKNELAILLQGMVHSNSKYRIHFMIFLVKSTINSIFCCSI